MTKADREAAQDSLRELRRQVSARNLTCHVYNPHSDLYWLFCAAGKFRYEYPVCGPLTHAGQKKRFTVQGTTSQRDDDAGVQIDYFDHSLPPELTKNILTAVSFNSREHIPYPVRIRLYESARDTTQARPLTEVVIFLNFGAVCPPEKRASLHRSLLEAILTIRPFLLRIAAQPRLDEPAAWILRNEEIRIRNRFSELRLGILRDHERSYRDFFDDIAFRIATSILVNLRASSKTLSCTISTADANNHLRIVGKYPANQSAPRDYEKGVVANVAHTGQLFYIRDNLKYRRRLDEEKVSILLPHYVASSAKARCQLAVPMLVKGRVVGVIELEADKPEAYDDGHVLTVFQISTSIALYLRLFALSKDSGIVIRMQHELLSLTSETEIYKKLIESCQELGYQLADVWDDTQGRWIASVNPEAKARASGFTSWVLRTGKPVAVADIHLAADSGEQEYRIFIRGRDSEEEFFDPIDVKADFPVHGINSEVMKLVETPDAVLTDLAFPIVVDAKVRAVLWAKCRRHYSTLLDDESWCLALLCRTTMTALKIRRA